MSQQPFVAGFFLILACITFSTTAQSNAQLIDCNANGIPDICDVGPCTCGAGDNLPDAILTIEISTDFFPEETTWELTDQTVGVVASGGPLDLPNTLIAQDVPVCSASCYDFTIFDVFGDGICCGGFYNLLLDGVLIATGTSFGFEETITNIGDCVVGTSEDCNADGIPDECEPMADCNGNSIRDSCDIANGTSSDCNANGIIDFCEIADGTSQDCNANGFPDVCDLMPFPQQAKLNAGDAEADDWFGVSVSISGDTAVIGSTLDDDAGHDSGSAYIFVRTGDTWTQQAKLTANDAANGDQFGFSVSINGDTTVIGSPGDRDAGFQSGSAYVFVRTGNAWTQQAKLTADDSAGFHAFGNSVSLNGDTAVIGSRQDDDAGFNSGSAYVFVRSGTVWTQQVKLTAADAEAGDQFGWSTAINGETAVIGSLFDSDAGAQSGSVYVFVRSAGVWSQQAKLTAADAVSGQIFGVSVSISGERVVIGSPWDDDAGAFSGSAYVFTRNTGVWTQQAKIIADDAEADDWFGGSVSVNGDTAVIGAFRDDNAVINTDSGSAYVFTRNTGVWTQQAKITAADAQAGDEFGDSVSVSGDTAVIGAFREDNAGTDSGSAYVFVFPPGSDDCDANNIPDECEIADGTSSDCNSNGIPDECDGFVDTTPPVINCEIVPAPEGDSEDSEDESEDDGPDQQSGAGTEWGLSSDTGNAGASVPNDSIDTIIQTGFGLIGTLDGNRDGIPIYDEGQDGPVMILFDATDDCGEVTVSAILDIGCEQIPIDTGTLIDFECNEGDDSGDCEVEEEDGILEIEAATAVITVTATDESGNTAICEIILCTPPDDSDDPPPGAMGNLRSRPTQNRPRINEDQPKQAAHQQPR